MSSREVNGGAARSATKKPRAPQRPREPGDRPPWVELLESMKSPSISLYRVYQRAGITKSRRYWLSRTPDLRCSVAYRMALAAGLDPGRFMAALAVALQPEPLLALPEDGRDRRRDPKPPRPGKKSWKCGLCHKPGHNRRSCRSGISSGALLLRARGAALAAHDAGKGR